MIFEGSLPYIRSLIQYARSNPFSLGSIFLISHLGPGLPSGLSSSSVQNKALCAFLSFYQNSFSYTFNYTKQINGLHHITKLCYTKFIYSQPDLARKDFKEHNVYAFRSAKYIECYRKFLPSNSQQLQNLAGYRITLSSFR